MRSAAEPSSRFCTQIVRPMTGVARIFSRPAFWPMGQHLTRHTRNTCRSALAWLPQSRRRPPPAARPQPSSNAGREPPAPAAIPRGGSLVVSVRTEPRSFNRLTARDTTTDLLSNLTQAKLVRINKVTQEVEPWLAESWTRSDDGRRYTLKLRPGVVFSDGQPFTSADVVFTFKAVYDEKTGSNLADSLPAERQEAAGDGHRSATPWRSSSPSRSPRACACSTTCRSCRGTSSKRRSTPGSSADAWSLATPPSEIVGLGPFVLAAYVPGQRLVFDRNPRYFRKAPDGRRAAVPRSPDRRDHPGPERGAAAARSGADRHDARREILPEAYAPLKRAADAGRVTLVDLGVGLDAEQPLVQPQAGRLRRRSARRVAPARRAAPGDLARRRSPAVRRHGLPGRRRAGLRSDHAGEQEMVLDRTCRRRRTIPTRRRRKLAAIGLIDRNGDGMLEDAGNRPAQFTLLTQNGPAGPRARRARSSATR